jgi:cephalosporin hydroxylase
VPRLALPAAVRRRLAPTVDDLVVRRYRELSRRSSRPPELDDATLAGFRRLAEDDLSRERPSAQVRQAVIDQFHRLYYHRPKQTWQNTFFLGVEVRKTPLDLWIYQEILHEVRPDFLVEAGTKFGGSAYYFARLFDLLGRGQVITIDVKPQPGRPEHDRITYLTGSSTDERLAAEVDRMLEGGTVMVVLDSAHWRNHVLRELRLWHSRVSVGSYIVVEDTHAGGRPVSTDIGPGPWAAIDPFLAETEGFEIDESRHKFLMTWNRRGYLKRVR